MTPGRLTSLLGAGVALPVLLAACSGATGGSTTTTRVSGHAAATSVCSLVTVADVEKYLGKMVSGPTGRPSTASVTCTYPAKAGHPATDGVFVSFHSGVTTAQFAAEATALSKLGGTTTNVSGNGDTAFSYTQEKDGATVNTLATLVGRAQVVVTSTASISQIEALTIHIFSSFGSLAATTTTTVAG